MKLWKLIIYDSSTYMDGTLYFRLGGRSFIGSLVILISTGSAIPLTGATVSAHIRGYGTRWNVWLNKLSPLEYEIIILNYSAWSHIDVFEKCIPRYTSDRVSLVRLNQTIKTLPSTAVAAQRDGGVDWF